ncbi:MAG: tetratricopeptide repeat protein [Spirochaetaceae bacterium]|nr:tetratricopeptide repeat protein [Spirochaetaceae bacterium]
MKIKLIGVFACILCIAAPFAGFCEDGRILLRGGIEAYRQSNFRAAANAFQSVVESDRAAAEISDAYFWLAKSLTALERFDEAASYLEYFLKNFSDSSYYPEAFYERGRLLYFQKEYDAAIVAFEHFLSRYPKSEYAANAYFWTGESLFAMGNLDTAQKMYAIVSAQYPSSSRVEAARYRAAIIGQKYREEELVKLLKWSHEEYIKSLAARRNLEKMYAEVVLSYQRQIAALSAGDLHAEVIRLSEEVRVLKAELDSRASAGGAAALSDAEFDGRMRMLSAREDAVKSKEAYLEQLIAEYEEKN